MNFDADLDSDDDTTGTKGKSEKDLDNFFKTLYGDLDEEGRRAMMKSYVESGGTVLSTVSVRTRCMSCCIRKTQKSALS